MDEKNNKVTKKLEKLSVEQLEVIASATKDEPKFKSFLSKIDDIRKNYSLKAFPIIEYLGNMSLNDVEILTEEILLTFKYFKTLKKYLKLKNKNCKEIDIYTRLSNNIKSRGEEK